MRFGSSHPYQVIVCGAGHAGCEAALASARRGVDTLLLSGNIDTIAQMSCNPAIGGLAKGNIVREIDALGGAMALNTDFTGIQFRLLNASKGLAVQGPRAQCDKKAYQFRMKHLLELQPHLTIFQAVGTGLIYQNGKVIGVKTNLDLDFYAQAVVITTGTFLRGLMHIGTNKNEGGRMGDYSAKTLSASLLEAGIELQRLKTGTPPRILGSTINFDGLEEQPGDNPPTLFAFHDTHGTPPELFHVEHSSLSDTQRRKLFHVEHKPKTTQKFHVEHWGQELLGWPPGSSQVSCWITRTTERTRELVQTNLGRSALYGGQITGAGPRYCPSIEDKFVKFAQKEDHQIFLEPEGRHTDEWYINGLSTSLPFDVQVQLVRSIKGLEEAQLLRPAYAVEYDFAPPTQLLPSLESRKVENLFFAGQINGTSGYEEAAGQGLIAGINAAAKVLGQPALVLKRHQAYIGVLIDDLVTKGTQEPYRMFTSRAEHRLLLNHGSAELRLGEVAEAHQVIDSHRLNKIKAKKKLYEHWIHRLETERTTGGTWADAQRRGETHALPADFASVETSLATEILYRVRYQGYIQREERAIEKMDDLEKVRLPTDINYMAINGLRKESAQKLQEVRPTTLAQASRISGVNPTDITLLMLSLRK